MLDNGGVMRTGRAGECVGVRKAYETARVTDNCAQGVADAFVGMIGLGCIQPGQLCLITGSSHLHCVVSCHNNAYNYP